MGAKTKIAGLGIAALLLIGGFMPSSAQSGKFSPGYKADDKASGIGIEIISVHTSPRCKATGEGCKWMIRWTSRKRADEIEFALTLAGDNRPSTVAFVNGTEVTRLDMKHPFFEIPLQTVSRIEVILYRKRAEIGAARF